LNLQDPVPLQVLTGAACFVQGPGAAAALPDWLAPFARAGTLLLICGEHLPDRPGPGRRLLLAMESAFPKLIRLRLGAEPTDLWLDQVRLKLREVKISAVISLGGGSVLDAGKALWALLLEEGPARGYLEGVGDRPPSGRQLPWFALPTTAGTGSEASTNAVISRPGPGGFKRSLRHPEYRAAGIVLDAELCRILPPLWSAACGMDTITQLLESWSSGRVTPELQACLETALVQAIPVLPRVAARAPEADPGERQTLLNAACLSGVGLSRAGLGTCHGLAGPVCALRPVPHGIACARLMGPCLRETLQWLEDHPDQAPRARADFPRLLQKLRAHFQDPLAEILSWPARFHIPPLSDWGFGESEIQSVPAQARDRDSQASLGPAVWEKILRAANGE